MQDIVNKWVIGMIDRLMDLFPQTGFAFAFEDLEDRNVVEVLDEDVFYSAEFRAAMYGEWMKFKANFPGQKILFITPAESFPLESPLYRVAAKQKSFSMDKGIEIKGVEIEDLFSSIPSTAQIKVGKVAIVNTFIEDYYSHSITNNPGNNSYAMAA